MYVGESRHVRSVHCFVPWTEATCLADIKEHLFRDIFDKNTLSYTYPEEVEKKIKVKNRKESLQQLCQSTSLADKAKGYGFTAWDSLKCNVGSLLEKIKDRYPNSKFYQIPAQPDQNGNVVKVKDPFTIPLNTGNLSKQVSSSTDNSNTLDDKPPNTAVLPKDKLSQIPAQPDQNGNAVKVKDPFTIPLNTGNLSKQVSSSTDNSNTLDDKPPNTAVLPKDKLSQIPAQPDQNGNAVKVKDPFTIPANTGNLSKQVSSSTDNSNILDDKPSNTTVLPEEYKFSQVTANELGEEKATEKTTPISNSRVPTKTPSSQPSPKSIAFQALSPEKKKLFKTYFQKSEETSVLYAIVKSESNSASKESAPSFKEWQTSCAWRNRAAFELLRGGSHHKAILGPKGFDILQDQVNRYEKTLQPKDSLQNGLKENLDHLLYKLFPDGPQRRDRTGYRFGSKGSLSVACAGRGLGGFWDFEKSEGGSLLKLIEMKLGMNPSEAKVWQTNF